MTKMSLAGKQATGREIIKGKEHSEHGLLGLTWYASPNCSKFCLHRDESPPPHPVLWTECAGWKLLGTVPGVLEAKRCRHKRPHTLELPIWNSVLSVWLRVTGHRAGQGRSS